MNEIEVIRSTHSEKNIEKESKIIRENQRKVFWNKLAYYLISFYAGISSITELAVSYYFKDHLLVGPSKLSQLTTAIALPWSLKPFLGLLTDCCPIFGLKRKYYIIICGLLSSLCWLLMSSWTPSLNYTFCFLLAINFSNAFSSVLGEAIVVDLAKNTLNENDEQKNKNAKDYISLFMIFKYTGMLFASFMKGQLVESIGINKVFFMGGLLPVLILLAGFILIDTKITKRKENLDEENSLILSNQTNGKVETENHTPTFSDMYNFITQRRVLIPLLFIILFMATPSYSDPFFYYLTNELKFTATALGQISFCSTIGVLMGIFIYKTYFKNAEFKSVLVFCTILSFIFTFLAYLLVLRVNVKYGINDFILVLFSNSVLSMLGEVMLLPLLSLACVLCPKNMEGTIFSVFMSALNFGGSLSSLFGSFITSHLEITSTKFDNLHYLIFISNVTSLLPLIVLFFISSKYFEH